MTPSLKTQSALFLSLVVVVVNTIQFISVGGIVIHSSFIGTLKLSKAVNMDFISLSIKDASALSTLN